MGLGKTIQTVSLVAALLQKKGTMEDLLEIRRREKAVATRKRLQQEALDEALQSGKAYTDPFLHQEDPIARFKWAPILILAPSSVMVNWKTDFGTWGHFSIASYDSASGYTGVDKVMDGLAEIMVSSHNIFMSNEHFNVCTNPQPRDIEIWSLPHPHCRTVSVLSEIPRSTLEACGD